MTKLCPRGKAAAKRKFKVYPSAYANAYASKICAGKIKDPSGVKRKDFRGPKPMSKGGGADTGVVGERRSKIGVAFNKAKRQGESILGPKGRKQRLKIIKGMAESAMNRENIKKRLKSEKSFAEGRRELYKSTAGKKIPAIKKGALMILIGVGKKKKADKKMGGGLAAATEKLKAKGLKKGGGADYMNTVKARKRGNPGMTEPKPKSLKEKNKLSGGGMARGGGAAIRGNKFQGIF